MIRKKILWLLLLLFIAGSVSGRPLLSKVQPQQLAPNFNLLDMDGNKHQLSDYRGKIVIVNFWASWCPPCREEMPSMERAWQKIKQEDMLMLAINVGEDEDTIFTFLGDYPVTFPVLLDETGSVSEQWPLLGLPTTFVVVDGKIIYRAVGGRNWDDEKILKLIRMLKPE